MHEREKSARRRAQWLDRRFSSGALRPRNAAYLIATIWMISVVAFGIVERIAEPQTFDSIWLAMWWAVQTVTTVGYGDVVPQQASGKVMGAVLMLIGLSFLSIITATITSGFVARRQAELRDAGEDPMMRRLNEIAARLDSMDAELRRLGSDAGPGDSSS
jgi:voltage-gated potassium channel